MSTKIFIPNTTNKEILATILIILVVVLGFFLRIYNIDNTPPGVYPDEAVNAIDAINANATGHYQWFYPANNGREGLFMNLIAICFKLFGISILTLKLPAILSGTLTIIGTYLLAKELFGRRMGLISSFLVATSFWAINFSRISFRANMLPLILVFVFYFLFKGLRTKKYLHFVLGGLVFGIGMHTYIAFRIAPAILIATLIALILSQKKFLKNYWRHILFFIFLAVLSASPMLYTFYAHPEFLESRSASVSIFSPEVNNGHPILTFLRSFSLSLIKYNLVGDMNWRHNYPPYPLLDSLAGLAFLLGIIFSIKIFFQILYVRISKKVLDANLGKYAFLLSWFFIMLTPEFLTAEGNPHALRAIGTLPVVFIFSAIGFNNLLKKSEKSSYIWKRFTFSMLICVFVSIGLFNSIKYHYFWAQQERVGFSFNKNLTDMQKYIQTLPPEKEKIIVTSYNYLEKFPIEAFTLDNNVSFMFPNELQKISPKNPADFMIFFTENNRDAMNKMRKKFPFLKIQEFNDTLGSIYYIMQ